MAQGASDKDPEKPRLGGPEVEPWNRNDWY